ncbi:type VI secretion protein IcmF/TssM N-terminal domain-containing protein [Yersinia enterocolitica]|uniref:type VI secretion protein IcmF/TssM N-terminal domain-containing protein n=1 Tax=Yersinia enterocolitica TaxID=630 RepID=UPI003AB2C2A0
MIKKFLILTLWLFALVFLFASCYIIGVLQYWTFASIFVSWLSVILVILFFNFLYNIINVFFKEGYYHKLLIKYRLSCKEIVFFSIFQKGRKILRSKRFKQAEIPWFILLGNHNDKGSLLNGTSLPLFYDTNEKVLTTPINTIRWLFFKNIAILELSDNLLKDSFSNIRKRLFSWIAKKPTPSGAILSLSISELVNPDLKEIQRQALKFRQLIDEVCTKVKQRIPVYLIITECNEIEGFSLWSKHLDSLGKSLPLGFCWDSMLYIRDNKKDYIHESFIKLKESMDFLRIKILESELSITDRHSLLSFPENLLSLEYSLNLFVSEFCDSDAYFDEVNLSGVWFSDIIESENVRYKSQTDILLSDIFPSLAARRVDTHYGFSEALKWITLSVISIIAIFSAYQTSNVIKENNDGSPESIIKIILNNENFIQTSPIHILFLPVLHWQQSQYYEQLRRTVPFQEQSVKDIIINYREKFYISSPTQKRDLILQLARSIIVWEEMRKGLSLSDVDSNIYIPSELKLTKTSNGISEIISLAIEQSEIKSDKGKLKLDEIRGLLNELIEYDQTLSWLLAPTKIISDVSPKQFWSESDSTAILSGIWTTKGQSFLHEWIDLLVYSSGKKKSVPEFANFLNKLPGIRQEAWRNFILEVSREKHYKYAIRTKRELLDVIYKQTPEAKFLEYLKSELNDISDLHAHDWLVKFRQLVSLQSLFRESKLMRHLQQSELLLRMHVISTLGHEIQPLTSTQLTSWWNWLDSLYSAVNEALNNGYTGDYLVRGIYTDNLDRQNANPLIGVFDNLDKVKGYLYSDGSDPVVDAIWTIYENQAYILLDNAIARAGYWLNENWNQLVLFPLNKEKDNIDHVSLQKNAYRYLLQFLRGPAKGFFNLTEDGVGPLTFRGRSFPVQESFVKLVSKVVTPDDLLNMPLHGNIHEQDALVSIQSKLKALNTELQNAEAVPYTLTVSSAPATISKGARVIPIGTKLKLECQFDSSVLESMNFADFSTFTWKAGQCQNVSIDVKFPSFSARYTLSGDSAWPDFLNLFSDGEAELPTEQFPHETAEILRSLGIKSILVRYKISDTGSLMFAFDNWHRIKNEINSLMDKQIDLSEKNSPRDTINNSGWLSLLPSNVFECQYKQE